MPHYDYKCEKCNNVFEVEQRITEAPLKECPTCKGPIKRLISAAGIVFKGSGFHINDYKAKNPASTPITNPASKEAKSANESKTTKETPCSDVGSKEACKSCPANEKKS